MVALTYAVGRIAAAKRARSETAAGRKNVFARFMDALIASRMEQARREIARHAHLIPKDFYKD